MSSLTLRLVAATILVVVTALPVAAQSPTPQQPAPEALAREAIDKLMQALSLAIQNFPQYEMPRLNERGDIIIRRVNPPSAPKPSEVPRNDDETRT
jgi:hypothetical protein